MIFGPVPSRRLGNSLGVNNIPPKECSYSCVYCQLGNTLKLEVKRKDYYSTTQIVSAIEEHLLKLQTKDKIDYITFVPDGEPTLDINLGNTIEACKKFGIKIAVITNASHIWDKDVQLGLGLADWVSLKIDSVNSRIWHLIDRPHGSIELSRILEGIKEFASNYNNYLVTETMLVKGLNESKESILEIAKFIKRHVKPNMAYISVPTRPPAKKNVESPSIESINDAYQLFKSKDLDTELIIGYEGNNFSSTGDFEEDILNITSVHPMRKDAVKKLTIENGATWDAVNKLIQNQKLIEISYNNEFYYLRNLKEWRSNIQ